jgi:hypothetical protein
MGHLQHAKDVNATCSQRVQHKRETITSHANININLRNIDMQLIQHL